MIGKSMEQIRGSCKLIGAYSNFGHITPTKSGAIRFNDDWGCGYTLTTHAG